MVGKQIRYKRLTGRVTAMDKEGALWVTTVMGEHRIHDGAVEVLEVNVYEQHKGIFT